MNSIRRQPTLSFGVVASLVFVIGLFVVFAYTTAAQAQAVVPKNGERLVTLHDAGRDRGILTKATTLRDAFAEANIPVDPNDIVEPGLDETLVASNYDVNVYRARPVTVVDGAVRQKVMSAYQTPKQIAQHAGITLQEEDIATLEASQNIVEEGAGIKMSIDRATEFTFVLYGKRIQAFTQAKTVGEMLAQKGITLGVEDGLSLPREASITPGMSIELWRNGKQTLTEERDVPFPVETVKDIDREVGYKQIKSAGSPGKQTVTYEIDVRDGKEVARKEIQSLTTKEPVKQIEIVGAKVKNTFSGTFAEALARLRQCESGGNYANKRNPTYRGAYQYNYSTWANYAGFYDPADAPPAVQDEKAWLTYQRRGWQPWPACSVKLGLQDIYR